MKCFSLLATCLVGSASVLHAQVFLDQVGEALSLSAFDDRLRARFSGTLDLEFYRFDQPPPGLIDADGHTLFNPRLTIFFDAQIGANVYFFSQARLDRGFDPTDEGAEIRLDEYAIRVTPWEDGRLSVQVGKFAAVVGNWMQRHLSWDNPFVTAPVAYENVTVIEDFTAPPLGYLDGDLRDEKYEYLPIIWGPSYASGLSVAGRFGKFEYAAEIKNASLSSRPESWDVTQIGFEHPTINARLGFRPNQMWNFGVSASDGPYFRPEAERTLPLGRDIGDYHQRVIGQDVSFAWRHFQLWAEFFQSRFEVPLVGDADAFTYYIEAKYKITPQLYAALRWNQQFFSDVRGQYGDPIPWGHDLSRIDVAVGYRFTEHTQLKVQYNLEKFEGMDRDYGHTLATQLTVRF